MIQIEVGARPNCDELLKMPIVKKRIDFFNNKNDGKEIKEENIISNKELLSTIRIPKNINNLSRNLPKPNYVSNSFDLNNNSINNNNESNINKINNEYDFLNINKKENILLNKISINIKKRLNNMNNNINSLSKKNLGIKYNVNNKLEDIFLKNKNIETPLKISINNSINKGINYYKKNSVISPMRRIVNNKNNISLGGKIILPELKMRNNNKNINLIRNISIVNNNLNKEQNRLIKMKNNNKLSINRSYKDLNMRDNHKQINENYEQKKSDNYNYQNLKVLNLNIIEPNKINIKKSLFRIGSPVSINRNYINNEKIINNDNNKYGYYNNKKLGPVPKKNIILNINL
jgi:hypothetical protein